MPYLRFQSNVHAAEVDGLGPLLSARLAELLGKPEAYVMVSLIPSQTMLFAGSDEPCAMIEIKGIGLTEAQAKSCTAALCELVAASTSIPAARTFVQFTDVSRTMWGINGETLG